MDHVVYIDTKADELENLLNGKKIMIIRGAMGKKLPYGRVNEGDILYFINNNAEVLIRANGVVSSVFNSEKMSKEDSADLIKKYQDKLQLTKNSFKDGQGKDI